MITGAHIIICSKEAEADRAFFREILNFPHVDVGHGWLIFRCVAARAWQKRPRHRLSVARGPPEVNIPPF
jgi:hypothetical protein